MQNYLNKKILIVLILFTVGCIKKTNSNQTNEYENSKSPIHYKYYRSLIGGGVQIKGNILDSCLIFPDSIKIIVLDKCFVKQKTFNCLNKNIKDIILNSCWTNEVISINGKDVKNFSLHFNNSQINFFELKNIDYIGVSNTNIKSLNNTIIQSKIKSLYILNAQMSSINLSNVNKLEIYDSIIDSIKINEIDTLIMNHLFKEPVLKIPNSTVIIRSNY